MANFKHISIDGTSYDAVPAGSYVTGVKGNSETSYRTGNVNITKANIGLGSVPNVSTNNQTPTFTQASTRANIASGETLTTILGKIMKFFADLKTVAFTGAYSDLTGLPTIPTVNNATLTIQKNGTNVQKFTANASSNKTANITVPTKTSELTNDSGFTPAPTWSGTTTTSTKYNVTVNTLEIHKTSNTLQAYLKLNCTVTATLNSYASHRILQISNSQALPRFATQGIAQATISGKVYPVLVTMFTDGNIYVAAPSVNFVNGSEIVCYMPYVI